MVTGFCDIQRTNYSQNILIILALLELSEQFLIDGGMLLG